LRVVQLTCSDGFGGVEQYLLNLGRGLAERGIDVTIIGGAEHSMRAAAERYGAWLPGNTFAQAIAALRSLGHVDLLNTHMSQADLAGCVARIQSRRLPQVSTRHFAARRGRNAATHAAFRVLVRGISAQIAISQFVAANVDGHCHVVRSGVAVADVVGQQVREPVVLVAQRLEPEKDTMTAVRAWALSSARNRGWKLQIAGAGSERERLESEVQTLGIQESVHFLGFRDDVAALLARSGAVFAPTPREGLGILVLEAMAAGTPVVAAAGGGHLETVGPVTPELLFDPGDATAAARVLDALTTNAAARRAAGAVLKDAQRRSFTIAAQIEATVAVYQGVLSS